LSKGCYRGQEAVAKVHNLGHPPRRLTLLNLETGDDLATVGDLVFYQDKQVGKVVASALHFELGSLALALMARNTPYLDLLVETSGRKVAASQQVLVPADAGKAPSNFPAEVASGFTKLKP
jgi:folate-binding Fe-S cluster repair protein YgfZ